MQWILYSTHGALFRSPKVPFLPRRVPPTGIWDAVKIRKTFACLSSHVVDEDRGVICAAGPQPGVPRRPAGHLRSTGRQLQPVSRSQRPQGHLCSRTPARRFTAPGQSSPVHWTAAPACQQSTETSCVMLHLKTSHEWLGKTLEEWKDYEPVPMC